MKKLFLLLPVLFLSSCIDMFSDREKVVLNKIYLTHTDANTIHGYSLSFKFAPSLYTPVVEEEILELKGDSSHFYLKTMVSEDTNFYYVAHKNGDTILSVNKIDHEKFGQETRNRAFIFMWPK